MLVVPLLISAMRITMMNRSAVNGVVNAVTGRNKDNSSNALVPVEETQESTQSEQSMQNEDPCMLQRMDFNNCLQVVGMRGESDAQNADKGVSECQIFFDSFKRCQERVKMESMNRFEYTCLFTNNSLRNVLLCNSLDHNRVR